MARITVEDCIEKVPNRFHLIQMASIRTKQLKKGAQPFVSADENKDVVVSLREIAAGYVKPDYAAGTLEDDLGEVAPEAVDSTAPEAVAAPAADESPAPAADESPAPAADESTEAEA